MTAAVRPISLTRYCLVPKRAPHWRDNERGSTFHSRCGIDGIPDCGSTIIVLPRVSALHCMCLASIRRQLRVHLRKRPRWRASGKIARSVPASCITRRGDIYTQEARLVMPVSLPPMRIAKTMRPILDKVTAKCLFVPTTKKNGVRRIVQHKMNHIIKR